MSKARDIVETLRTVLVDGDVTNANFTGADLDIAKGGTGASTAGAARTALGLAIGSDVQAHDADTAKLDANANFTGTLQRGGTDVLVTGDVTNANFTGADLEIAKGGTGASSAGAARTALGVAIGTDVLAPDGDGSGLTGVDSLPSQTSQTGKFLTTNGSAASWGTVAPAGVVLISSITASASASVEFSNKFSSTYDYYFITVSGLKASGTSTDFLARFEMNGTFTTDSTYNTRRDKGSFSSSSASYQGYSNNVNMVLGFGLDNNRTVDYKIEILGANNATYMGHRVSSKGNEAAGGTMQDAESNYTGQATTATGIRFLPHAGTLYGRFNLYGVSK